MMDTVGFIFIFGQIACVMLDWICFDIQILYGKTLSLFHFVCPPPIFLKPKYQKKKKKYYHKAAIRFYPFCISKSIYLLSMDITFVGVFISCIFFSPPIETKHVSDTHIAWQIGINIFLVLVFNMEWEYVMCDCV